MKDNGGKRFTLNQTDLKKWLKNAGLFLAPALILFLLDIQAGKSVSDAFIALKGWALATALDLLRKFVAKG